MDVIVRRGNFCQGLHIIQGLMIDVSHHKMSFQYFQHPFWCWRIWVTGLSCSMLATQGPSKSKGNYETQVPVCCGNPLFRHSMYKSPSRWWIPQDIMQDSESASKTTLGHSLKPPWIFQWFSR
jgi:hypothetical protein